LSHYLFMADPELLFDSSFQRKRVNRASKQNLEPHFLSNWIAKEMSERLKDLTRDFQTAFINGDFFDHSIFETSKINTGYFAGESKKNDIACTPLALPYGQNSTDLFLSLTQLHRLNDPKGFLIQALYSLKPDGFFLCAFPGGNSLAELETCLSEVENEIRGGISPRILPMLQKQDVAALMQNTGFALPVIDNEKITVTYSSLKDLIRDIRLIGGGNSLNARNTSYVGRDFFERVETLYFKRYSDGDGRIPVTIDIIFASGWAPHSSQQKPAPRGSAEISLKDVL